MNRFLVNRRPFATKNWLATTLVLLAAVATPIQSIGAEGCCCGCCRLTPVTPFVSAKVSTHEKSCCSAHPRPSRSAATECNPSGALSCNCAGAIPAVTVVSNSEELKSKKSPAYDGQMIPYDALAGHACHLPCVGSDAGCESSGGRDRIILLRRLRI